MSSRRLAVMLTLASLSASLSMAQAAPHTVAQSSRPSTRLADSAAALARAEGPAEAAAQRVRDARRYAKRDAVAKRQRDYRGGSYVVIGLSTTAIIVIVVLLILL